MPNSPPLTIGYCTNVHPGTTLSAIQANLVEYSQPIRERLGAASLGVGLWIPESAANQTSFDPIAMDQFLDDRGLVPFTVNAFPIDDFHDRVVKHSVYQPPWWESRRLDYTVSVATILAKILAHRHRNGSDRIVGSVSTLPLGWPPVDANESKALVGRAGENLRQLALQLNELEKTTGVRITVAIEPEPGCMIATAKQAIDFFESELPDAKHRRHLSICHDVCHAAVMDESQTAVIHDYAAAGIEIGKLQVSSAIVAPWELMAVERRHEAMKQLSQFAEDRYLHQTGRRKKDGTFSLHEDLPLLLKASADQAGSVSRDPVWGDHRWVVHFHVPIFLARFGHLTTTQDDIVDAFSALFDPGMSVNFTGHVEVETYAWSVLPETMRRRGLVDEVADELRWLKSKLVELSIH